MTKKKETFDFDDIVQEDSPLKPAFVRIPSDFFGGLNTLWERMFHWCIAHPKEVLYQVNYDKKEHTWYFTSREAYLDFVKEFPEVLRGEDSEF
jgi:hypothetical protein